jgi:hypothetical protein
MYQGMTGCQVVCSVSKPDEWLSSLGLMGEHCVVWHDTCHLRSLSPLFAGRGLG